jgi:hypothetical protein
MLLWDELDEMVCYGRYLVGAWAGRRDTGGP